MVGGLLNQGPDLMALALVLTALRLHVSGALGLRPVLPIPAAVCVGLAMLIHVEFVTVWLGMVLHAMLLAHGERPRFTLPTVLLRGLIGLALFALVAWPVVHRNYIHLGTAWQGAREAMPLHSGGLSDLAPASGGLGASLAGAFAGLFGVDGWPAAVFLLLAVVGVGVLGSQWARRERSRAFLVAGFLLLLAPLALGLFGDGAESWKTRAVLGSMFPLWAMAGVFALHQFGISKSRRLGAILVSLGAAAWAVASVVGTLQLAASNHSERAALSKAHAAYTDWHQQRLRNKGFLRVVTDAPGWMAYTKAGRVALDLKGWATPLQTDACRNGDGALDAGKLMDAIGELDPKPQAVVLWSEEGKAFAEQVRGTWKGLVAPEPSADDRPAILVVQPRPPE